MAGHRASSRVEKRTKQPSKSRNPRTSHPSTSSVLSRTLPERLTALEQSNLLYEASLANRCEETRQRGQADDNRTQTTTFSPQTWRFHRVRMSAPSRPIPTPPTALEQSNALYAATLARERAEKTLATQPECAICCLPFSNDNQQPHSPPPPGERTREREAYTCPNATCTTLFCSSCKTSTLEHDYRCPFCRCELDGATVRRPRWRGDEMDEADLRAFENGQNDESDVAREADAETLRMLDEDPEIVEELVRDGVLGSASDFRPVARMGRLPRWRGFGY